MDRFTFRRLVVYRKALDMVGHANEFAARIPRDHVDLKWQLRRAARSVVLNIAEGAGEYSPKEKARLYRIARRSAWETIAALDMGVRDGFFDEADLAGVLGEIDEITAMLTTMVQRAERRGRHPKTD
ncbi:MAG TPA: four helix bundle protein [Longimicrobiales bacterium]|nr:four helix bundle protein [Longimicrobiales bacterium]